MNPQNIIQEINFSEVNNTIEECQRLFHGRGHAYEGLEHINVDWLSPVILITIYQEVDEKWLCQLARELKENIPQCKSVQVQYRCRPRAPFQCILGDEIFETIVCENGLKYKILLGRSQNTGLFLDMRNGREWVRQNAAGKRVLNLFAYTCAFSVAALAGGAEAVVNVDNNKSVLSRGRENHRLNLHDMRDIRFEKVDIFKSYGRIRKYGPYDLLICDPPSFQVGSVDIKRDYRKIISRIPQWVNDGGKIMLCLNSPELNHDFLLDLVNESCSDCHFIESISPPAVYKEAMPGKGLKVVIFTYNSAG